MHLRPLPAPARATTLALTFLAGAAGCSGGDESRSEPVAVVRDSAGITIVESPPLGPDADLGWTVDSVPLLDIGTLEGPPETQLYRVLDAHLLPDGGVAVLNAGTAEVRFFSASGVYRSSFGGEGEGPGEFSRPGALHPWPGDSLAVWDAGPRRVTLIAPDGSLGRIFTLPQGETGTRTALSHRLPGGELAVTRFDFMGDGLSSGYQRIPVHVELIEENGARIADLGSHPGDETFMSVSQEMVSIVRLPFARGWVVAPHGAETIVAPNDRLEIRYYDATGALARIARVEEPPRLTTEADRQAELERRLANAPEPARPGIRTLLREHPGTDTLPAFTAVTDDALGDTWIQTFRSPADTGPDRWIVLRPDGAARGTVALPPGIEVFEMGEDWILGRWTDDLDVEHVRVWRLRREVAP